MLRMFQLNLFSILHTSLLLFHFCGSFLRSESVFSLNKSIISFRCRTHFHCQYSQPLPVSFTFHLALFSYACRSISIAPFHRGLLINELSSTLFLNDNFNGYVSYTGRFFSAFLKFDFIFIDLPTFLLAS